MSSNQISKSVFILAGFAPSLVIFRLPLIKQLLETGHRVAVGAKFSEFRVSDLECLRALGVQIYDVDVERSSIGILRNLRTFWSMRKALKKANCDVLIAYTMIPVVFGTMAAKLVGYRYVIPMVTGLGSMFIGTPRGLKQRGVRFVVRQLYRLAFAMAEVVYFQNPDDPRDLRRLGVLSKSTKTSLINGSGVDTRYFAQVDPPAVSGQTRFLMVARLLKDKGVLEYAEATQRLSRAYPEAQFALVGPFDNNPSAISPAELAAWTWIEHQEWLDDVRPELHICDVFVLPSYREGTPRSVLEAMSVGRPIVTTDVPGCRETVADGVNGYLVPFGDSVTLGNVMERFLVKPALAAEMGRESRKLAVQKYDANIVYREKIQRIQLLT